MLVLTGSSSASPDKNATDHPERAPHWLALSSYESQGGIADASDREDTAISKDGRPTDADAPKPKPATAPATRTDPAPAPATPKGIAQTMVAARGWSSSQWTCLEKLWTRESHFRVNATNATSGAYGIPQALPAEKMAVAGADWRTNPRTQIRWGLDYITDRYENPCGAWKFWRHHSWY
jgi:hypothetical protein